MSWKPLARGFFAAKPVPVSQRARTVFWRKQKSETTNGDFGTSFAAAAATVVCVHDSRDRRAYFRQLAITVFDVLAKNLLCQVWLTDRPTDRRGGRICSRRPRASVIASSCSRRARPVIPPPRSGVYLRRFKDRGSSTQCWREADG